uniref:Uncharacterized protein n=1 Tax=Panagrolaimus sp. ES5 TaxID=591445 RepID=A0AC34FVX2_9BILA
MSVRIRFRRFYFYRFEKWILTIYIFIKILSTFYSSIPPDETEILEPYSLEEFLQLKKRISTALDILPSFRENVSCPILFDPSDLRYPSAKAKASKWRFESSDWNFWKQFEATPNICQTLKQTFSFFSKPLSFEEAEYPIAYGMLVYKDIKQLLYVLSAFYQPQNAYCIAIDGRSSGAFKNQMQIIQSCFPNIHVFVTKRIEYCGPQIPEAVLTCVDKLNERKHRWEYYQYLSGVDLPLKTNLEMVRIFKALNGTFNAEVTLVNSYRYAKSQFSKPPLPLWKSSLSATFSRESANIIAKSPTTFMLLLYLRHTRCSDETLWATLGGNPDYIPMPGGFSAIEFYSKILSDLYGSTKSSLSPIPSTSKQPFPLRSYYISRYQVWDGKDELGTDLKCAGNFLKESCVFGIGDLPNLVIRPEIVAHKFYVDKDPAAFFCFYEKIRERALNYLNQQSFDASYYSELPQVQLSKGKSLDQVKFFF